MIFSGAINWLGNRIRTSSTANTCLSLYYRQFITNIKTKRLTQFLVFIRIRWIGTGSHPYEKTMSSIVFYPAFYEYKNVQS